MRIVFVDTTLKLPPTGGAHTFLLCIGNKLVGRGLQVAVVTQPGPELSVADSLRECGVEVIEDCWQSRLLPDEQAAQLADWVDHYKPDAYVISTSPDVGWLALPRLARTVATLAIAHNDVDAYYAPLHHYGSFIDCAIGVSAETHRKIVQRCTMPGRRAREIPYGVYRLPRKALDRRCVSDDCGKRRLQIGYVGRLVQAQKRVLDLPPLVSELERRCVDFDLHIVGDGSERSELERAFVPQVRAGKVHFWGWLAPERVRERLCELDVFVLLSDFEGLSVALLEAMAHAVVPVVTRIASGNSQVIREGENGHLVAIGDITAFADRLADLASNRVHLRAMGRVAWSDTEAFTVESMANNYLKCFEELTSPSFCRGHRPEPGRYPVMPSCQSRYPTWLRKIKSSLKHALRA